jgi:hypothetical protein
MNFTRHHIKLQFTMIENKISSFLIEWIEIDKYMSYVIVQGLQWAQTL